MKKIISSITLIFLISIFTNATDNLFKNPDFETGLSHWVNGAPFNGAIGSVQIYTPGYNSNKALHFKKESSQGGVQIWGNFNDITWDTTTAAASKLSLWHKGERIYAHIRFFDKITKKPFKDEFGKNISILYVIPKSTDWSFFEKDIVIPKIHVEKDPALRILVQNPLPGESFIDNCSFTIKPFIK